MSDVAFAWVKFWVGMLLLFMGLGYIYHPNVIARIYRVIRELMLNESRIMLERKKWGFFFLMMGAMFVYMGMSAMERFR